MPLATILISGDRSRASQLPQAVAPIRSPPSGLVPGFHSLKGGPGHAGAILPATADRACWPPTPPGRAGLRWLGRRRSPGYSSRRSEPWRSKRSNLNRSGQAGRKNRHRLAQRHRAHHLALPPLRPHRSAAAGEHRIRSHHPQHQANLEGGGQSPMVGRQSPLARSAFHPGPPFFTLRVPHPCFVKAGLCFFFCSSRSCSAFSLLSCRSFCGASTSIPF